MGNSKSKTQIIGENDVVVFLVGPTGAGKSTLMRVLDNDERANRIKQKLDPSTKDVQAWKYTFNEVPYNIVLVDTPSFLTGHDIDAEGIMRKWIQASKFAEKCRRSGILYLHNLAGDPAERGLLMQRHLSTFKGTFPRGCTWVPSRVCVVPTIDKALKPGCNSVQEHFPKLQAAVNSVNSLDEWNASMFSQKFRDEPGIACNAIQNLLGDIA